jgi:hypothetical protein
MPNSPSNFKWSYHVILCLLPYNFLRQLNLEKSKWRRHDAQFTVVPDPIVLPTLIADPLMKLGKRINISSHVFIEQTYSTSRLASESLKQLSPTRGQLSILNNDTINMNWLELNLAYNQRKHGILGAIKYNGRSYLW